ncbi:MAG: hypothetical protein L6V82_04315 [Clostridiales bacterium]|nr:MAG: hypothetical protein L6V82_04315 [Clostridiales bacterium]
MLTVIHIKSSTSAAFPKTFSATAQAFASFSAYTGIPRICLRSSAACQSLIPKKGASGHTPVSPFTGPGNETPHISGLYFHIRRSHSFYVRIQRFKRISRRIFFAIVFDDNARFVNDAHQNF